MQWSPNPPSVCQVLSTSGDSLLGGDDWDAALAAYLVAQGRLPPGLAALVAQGDPRGCSTLLRLAEGLKRALSEDEEAEVLAGGVWGEVRGAGPRGQRSDGLWNEGGVRGECMRKIWSSCSLLVLWGLGKRLWACQLQGKGGNRVGLSSHLLLLGA